MAPEKLSNITNCKNMDFPWSPQFLLSRSENGHGGSVFIVNHLEGSKCRFLSLVCHRRPFSRCRDSTELPRARQLPWLQCSGAARLPAVSICALCAEISETPHCCRGTRGWVVWGLAPLTAVTTQVMFEFSPRFPDSLQRGFFQDFCLHVPENQCADKELC